MHFEQISLKRTFPNAQPTGRISANVTSSRNRFKNNARVL